MVMTKLLQVENHAERVAKIPKELSILPLRNSVAFPFSVIPLGVGIPRSIKLVEDALEGNRTIGLVAMKDSSIEEPQPGQVYEVGTVAKVHQMHRAPDKSLQVIVEGLERFRIERWLGSEPYLQARIALAPDVVEQGVELDALVRSLRDLAEEVVTLSPNLPDEAGKLLNQVEDPRYLTYLIAANAGLQIDEGQTVLEMDDVKDKLRTLISHLTHEREILTLGKKIQSEAREEMDKAQREYYLRQQLKAIQKELGERSEGESAGNEYAQKIEKAEMPEEARKEAERELKRLEAMSPQSAEYSVIKTYLDWLVELPWNVLSEDQLDIEHARGVLDEDHYDLEEVKDRIIEYLGVRKLVSERGVETQSGEEVTASEAWEACGMRRRFADIGAPISVLCRGGSSRPSSGREPETLSLCSTRWTRSGAIGEEIQAAPFWKFSIRLRTTASGITTWM